MPVYVLPKSPKSMPMPMPVCASASTMPIFDLNRTSGPTNPPDNPFGIHDRPHSPNSGLAPRLPEVGRYGGADPSLGRHNAYSPNRRDAGSSRRVSGHECSASFEATQSLTQSLAQMRALRGRPVRRMPQAPIAGPSSPPTGLVAPRPRVRLPIPTFDIAPTVPLPESPWTGRAHTSYQPYDQDATDDPSAILTEADMVDRSYTYSPSYDDEGASIIQAQMSFLVAADFNPDSLPVDDENYPGPYGDDSFLSIYNDEGYSYVPAQESPILRAASPRTFLGNPPRAPLSTLWFDRELLTPSPMEVDVLDSDGGSEVVYYRTGRPEIPQVVSPAINGYSSPAVQTHPAEESFCPLETIKEEKRIYLLLVEYDADDESEDE
ncbi:hypothetical protein FS749_002512 [Ceratobasidium sp. UAMH 11750]|nr:hypothetical protein FS749_002512 [Ceratobasidium sp. UAMH 11750]